MALEGIPLETLCATCEHQLQRFRLRGESDTSSCDEILRQAAAHDETAIAVLIHVSEPLVRTQCRQKLRYLIDDWTQDVLLQIVMKMPNHESPYRIYRELPPAYPSRRGGTANPTHHAWRCTVAPIQPSNRSRTRSSPPVPKASTARYRLWSSERGPLHRPAATHLIRPRPIGVQGWHACIGSAR